MQPLLNRMSQHRLQHSVVGRSLQKVRPWFYVENIWYELFVLCCFSISHLSFVAPASKPSFRRKNTPRSTRPTP